jgi:hypothetical protein
MGNPKFYYFPQPNGSRLVTIDIGEPLAELFSDFEVTAATSVALNGGMRRTTGTHREVVTIQRDRLKLGEDLAIQLAALQNHLDRGFTCSFANDSSKAYCFPTKTAPTTGSAQITTDGDPFRGYTGSTLPGANDYVVVESQNPELLFEQHKISTGPGSSQFGGAFNLNGTSVNFNYDAPAYVRYYRFWPALKRPESQIGQNIITNETGRLFSLNLTLVVDYEVAFGFHPNITTPRNTVPWSTADGLNMGSESLDSAGPINASQDDPMRQFTPPDLGALRNTLFRG